MPSDIRSILRTGAARPSAAPKIDALLRRANRLRWSRRLVVASTAIVVAGGTWATAGSFDLDWFGQGSAPAGDGDTIRICATLSWGHTERHTEMSVFLRDDITEAELSSLVTDLQGTPGVIEVTYVSKQQAFEEFKRLYADQPEYYESLPADALPAYIGVQTEEGTDLDAIDDLFEGAAGVDEVRFGGDSVPYGASFCED